MPMQGGGTEIIMSKKLTAVGILLVSICGTFLHFVYGFSGESFIAGLFAPVNESVWEHMKLIFFPMLIFLSICYFPLKKSCPSMGFAMSSGLALGTFSIPVMFYTYSGILGFNLLAADIAVFYISVIIAFLTVRRLSFVSYTKAAFLPELIVFLLLIAFLIFSHTPPDVGVFKTQSALTESYQTEYRVVDYIEKLCVNILGNKQYTGIFDNLFDS